MRERCEEIQAGHARLSVRRQCALLGLNRSSYYYEPGPESRENLELMRRLDQLHTRHPVYGSPRLTIELRRDGWAINPKRVARLMRLMGIEAIYPKASGSQPAPGHEIYPYLLRDKEITGPDQVWCADITYIPMRFGFMYLVAVMDWWSRYVLAWRLSNTLEAEFCVEAWQAALRAGRRQPRIANTDQGLAIHLCGVCGGGAGHRFGTLVNAYRLIGYNPGIDFSFIEENRRLRKRHPELVAEVIQKITALGAHAVWNKETELLDVNHEMSVSIVLCRHTETGAGSSRWLIRLDASARPDITIAVRMDATNEGIRDYYVLPAIDMTWENLRVAEVNGIYLDTYRCDTLDYFFGMAERVNLEETI